MARTENPFDPPMEEASLGDDEDVDRVRDLLGGQPKKQPPLRWQRPDPSENQNQPLLDRIMYGVEANSNSEEEFTENYKRVLEALKTRGITFDNADELLSTYLQRWNKARTPDTMPDVKEIPPEELDAMEREKRTKGLGHGP